MLPDEVVGSIGLWSGTVVSIPPGWHLCDGTNGTPDLTDKFVVGAGTTYNPSDTGGSEFHTHDFTGDGHDHALLIGAQVTSGPDFNADFTTDAAVGTTDDQANPLIYYSLAYIMYTGV